MNSVQNLSIRMQSGFCNAQAFRLGPSSVAASAAARIAAQLAESRGPLEPDVQRLLQIVLWQVTH